MAGTTTMGGQEEDRPFIEVRHKALLTIAIMGATLLQILDTTIANVALPHMQASLGATQDSVSWVLTSYIIASAIAIPITGWLSDRIGIRPLMLVSVAAFIIASMLCGIATSLEEMVGFRILQGISGAFVAPLAQSLLLDINKPSDHARTQSVYGMGIMIGPILGPIVGGWLTENFNWRWVFYVNVPIGLLCLGLLFALLPDKERRDRRFDLFGFAMLAIGLGAFQLMLDRGEHVDWFNSVEIWVELALMVAAFWIFIIHMMTAREPIYDTALVKDRNFLAGMFFMFVLGLITMSAMALLPGFLQGLFGYPVMDTGILLSSRGVGVMVSMYMVGRVAKYVDPRLLLLMGFGITALSLYLMTRWSLDMDWHPVVVSGIVQGVGLGLIFVPLSIMAFATLTPHLRTEASSMLSLVRNLGQSIGITLVTVALARNTQVSHADLSAHITNDNLGVAVRILDLTDGGREMALSMINAEINRQAAMIAYLDDFKLLMIATLASLPLILLLRKPNRPITEEDMAIGE